MTTQDVLRPGTTFTHRGAAVTVTRIIGRTVVVRDRTGHTHYLWEESVRKEIEEKPGAAGARRARGSDTTQRACVALGITHSAAPESRVRDKAAVPDFFHDAEEYLRSVLAQDKPLRTPPGQPRPIVHLFRAPTLDAADAA